MSSVSRMYSEERLVMEWAWRVKVRDLRESLRIGFGLLGADMVIWSWFDSIGNVAGLPDESVGCMR